MDLLPAAASRRGSGGYFRRRAAATDPVTLTSLPGLGEVLVFGTKQAARDIFTAPAALCRGSRSQPDRADRRPGSLILISGEHRRPGTCSRHRAASGHPRGVRCRRSRPSRRVRPGHDKVDAREHRHAHAGTRAVTQHRWPRAMGQAVLTSRSPRPTALRRDGAAAAQRAGPSPRTSRIGRLMIRRTEAM